jgi:hypothetical protein
VNLPPDVSKGSVEIIIDGSYVAPDGILCDGPPLRDVIECYRLGAMAVHPDDEDPTLWRVTHAATGLSCWTAPDLETALQAARAVDAAIDWSQVTRSENLFEPHGWTEERADAVRSVVTAFPGRFLPRPRDV